jgi:hypothetical protein
MADENFKSKLDERYRTSLSQWNNWWYEADLDMRMAIGDQSIYNDLYYSASPMVVRRQQRLYFNKIRRIINMIQGFQRRNRLTTIVSPRTNEDQETADILSAAVQWAMQVDNTYHTISDAFEGALITGLNMLYVWMDYREDPENGDIRVERMPWNSFLMDPFWTKPTLEDCNWVWTRKFLSPAQVKSIMPKQSKEIDALKNLEFNKDGRFQFLPQNFAGYSKGLMSFDEIWERDYRKQKMLINKATGEMVPYDGDEEKLELYKRYAPQIEVLTKEIPTIKLYIMINGELMYEELTPDGLDRLPFVPITCYHQPEVASYGWRMQGIVRNLRDVQRELNHRRNVMSDILDSQVNSGLMAKEDALVNPEDAFLQGQGRVLFLKRNAQMTDVQHIPPPALPQSLFELQGLMDKEIVEISGATEELFGANNDQIAGVLSALRQGAGLTSLQKVFDQLNLSQAILGQIHIGYMQHNWSPEKLQKITNKPVGEEFKSRRFARYDAVVEEGLLTSTQKQMQFAQMLQLQQLGVPIPTKELIRCSTLQNKNELLEAIEEQDKSQQQIQEMQLQQQQEMIAAKIEATKAQSIRELANAEERHTRSIANMGLEDERISKSVEDRSLAVLNRAKAMKELESLDTENLLQLFALYQQMQAMGKMEEEETKMEDVGIADQTKGEFAMRGTGQTNLGGMLEQQLSQTAQPGGMPWDIQQTRAQSV